MSVNRFLEHSGPADIELSGLGLWFHHRQFPEAQDYWDGNWLITTAICSAEGAHVWVNGPDVHLSEIEQWAEETQAVHTGTRTEASLECIEPAL